jgi:hypothetical protein
MPTDISQQNINKLRREVRYWKRRLTNGSRAGEIIYMSIAKEFFGACRADVFQKNNFSKKICDEGGRFLI